ncbi:glycosyltransferase family 4 protein [Hymenobacter yonginensis]|uniref:Glycosyltransferase family 4 protein n=1 Tax=Hymenobacter yonginensis TaxID=748197 RepID=A0ABY7PRF6_9BACT|nr:glycosyltransferase family 4 protein [Hymenobacter yonginensis]WBO85406.1 glycosyltransferase family 4 protein [Hymenobacter yonginensis]
MKRILAVHLLNDRSGSPLVLRNALLSLRAAGFHIDLLTGTPAGETGFLSDLPGISTHALPYQWSPSRWRTLLRFAWVQLVVFARVLQLARPGTVVYVNSLLPAAAALAARCRGARVVYHLHEVSIRPALLMRLLRAVANRTAHRALFVSEYVRQALALRVPRQAVVPNVLSAEFIAEAQVSEPAKEPFMVLMACSLKDYKGVPEFVALARAMPELRFELVLNAPAAQVQHYRQQHALPPNLTLFAAVQDMHPFYRRAAVVANLSRPTEWIETFGMTILEALQHGRPVLVPTVGGVSEVNQVGQTGFAIDGHDLPALQLALNLLATNRPTYLRMAAACRHRAAHFSPARFAEQLQQHFQTEMVLPGRPAAAYAPEHCPARA